MDVGGRPAQALSEFYASIFAQILQASQSASRAEIRTRHRCVRNVRDAWRQVARDPEVESGATAGDRQRRSGRYGQFGDSQSEDSELRFG